MRRPVHVLVPVIGKLAGGAHKLAEASIRPCVEIVARVDRELAGLAKRWTAPDGSELCQCRRRTRDAVIFTDVACGIRAAHVQCGMRLHAQTPVLGGDFRSMRAYPVWILWRSLVRLTLGSDSGFRLASRFFR